MKKKILHDSSPASRPFSYFQFSRNNRVFWGLKFRDRPFGSHQCGSVQYWKILSV